MSSITAFPDAVVQDYTPGVMLTLEISSADIEKCRSQQRTVEVNFKSFFKPLKSKLDIVKCSKDGVDTSDVGCDGLLRTTDTNRSSETAKPSLVNDNIIDRLVRKYYSQATFQGNDYDSGDSSDDNTSEEGGSASNQERDSDNDTGVGSSELVFVNVRKGGESRRLRQDCVEDYYDPEDPFIDDSDKVFEIEADLRMHKTKTKHNGFFVSVGKLHVTEIVDDHQESPPKKRSIHRSESDSQRPKISWRPVKEVQLALTRFSDVFVASGVKLVRSSHVPFRLEDDLLALNRITLSHYPAALDSNALSYVESVHEILGGELPVGRVRTTLTRLVAKDNADSAGARLDEMVAQLCADLRPLVIPCPDAMQPANKVKAQQTASAPECAAQESVVVAAPLVVSEATATTALTTEGASDDVAVQGAASEVVLVTREEEAKPLVVYKWYCKWSAATRAQALAVWQQTVDWVRLENIHRNKLTVVTMRELSEDDCELMDEKDELAAVMGIIADSLPESCGNGDVAAVRRVVGTERSRVKKIHLKEQQAREAAADTTADTVPDQSASVVVATPAGVSEAESEGLGNVSTGPEQQGVDSPRKRPKSGTVVKMIAAEGALPRSSAQKRPGTSAGSKKTNLVPAPVLNAPCELPIAVVSTACADMSVMTAIGAEASQGPPPKKARLPRSKPSWEPSHAALQALAEFRAVFLASAIKLFKSSSIPSQLDDSLLTLNREVLPLHPLALSSSSVGYVESVHEILGGELPVGRVRTTLTRLVAKDNADSAGARLDEMVAQLCADLRPLVIPCPDAMQPANKVKAQQTASAPECAAQESVVVAAPLVASEATATTALTTEGASDDVAVQGAASEVVLATKEEEAKPLVVYKWYCKWSAATRAQALAVWQQTVDWVRLENVCRAKMGRVSALDEKDAVTERLRAVADSLPESCCNGDLSAVRKAVSNEKNRLKKIQQKEALAKQAALSWVPKALSAPGLASASEDMQGSAAATVSLSSPKKSTAAGAERSPTKRPRKPSIAQFAVLDSAVQENSCSVPVAGLSEGAPRRKRVKKLTTAQFTATPATAISAQAHESLPVGSPHRLESSAEVEMRNECSVEATTVQPESAFAPSTEFAELS